MHNTIVGEKISLYLRRREMQQKELAIRTGISESTISRYINGTNIPRHKNLGRIAKELGVSEEDLQGTMKDVMRHSAFEAVMKVIKDCGHLLTLEQKAEAVTTLLLMRSEGGNGNA